VQITSLEKCVPKSAIEHALHTTSMQQHNLSASCTAFVHRALYASTILLKATTNRAQYALVYTEVLVLTVVTGAVSRAVPSSATAAAGR
jgi:hypothetical protein